MLIRVTDVPPQQPRHWWDRYDTHRVELTSLPWLTNGQQRSADWSDLATPHITATHGVGSGKTVEIATLLRVKLLATRRREQIRKERQQEEICRRIELRTRRRDLIAPPEHRAARVFENWEPPGLPVDSTSSAPPLPWDDAERPRSALLTLEDVFLQLVYAIADTLLTRALCDRYYEFLDAVPPVASSPCGVVRLRSSHVPRAPDGSGHTSDLSAKDALVG